MSFTNIISLEDAKEVVTLNKTEDDDVVERSILQATSLILSYLGIPTLDKGEYSQVFNSKKNTLKTYPIYLSTISIDETADFEVYYDPNRAWEAGSLVPAYDYYVDFAARKIDFFGTTLQGTKTIKVVYTSGFDIIPAGVGVEVAYLDIPRKYEAIKNACRVQTTHMYSRNKKQNMGNKSSGRDPNIRALLCNEARELLLPFTAPRISYV